MNNVTNSKLRVVVFSPALNAVSGVSTHVNMLFNSRLTQKFELLHFQVGREGRSEGRLQRLLRFAFSPLQLAALIVRHRPRIAHINTSMDSKAFWRDLSYLIVARLLGCRVVNQIHSGSAPQSLFTNPLLTLVLKGFLLASHVVVVLSSEATRSYEAFDPRIALRLAPNAIDATKLMEVGPKQRSDDPQLKLVYVGRIMRSKGLLDALEALKLLKDEKLQFCFQVAGSGPDEGAASTLIESLGLTKEVTMLGPVFGDAKNKLWLDSDIQLFPTYHNEGLPYSILESLAAGCVPITCAVAAIPDVMQDGIHGLFVPAHDPPAIAAAIRRLAANREELNRMSHAGRQRISDEYTVDHLATRFGDIYTMASS